MAASYEIQYFRGATPPAGFYSLYSELLPPETANAIYILKGGPGCGKSTLMRRVAQRAVQAGETGEYSAPGTRTPWTAWSSPAWGPPWWMAPRPMAQHH